MAKPFNPVCHSFVVQSCTYITEFYYYY